MGLNHKLNACHIALDTKSHLKNRILVQDQGGAELQAADILKYFYDLKRGPNAGVGPKDIFEIASNAYQHRIPSASV